MSIDQAAEIIRLLALMGLAEEWHVEPDPNGIPDMVILRGRKVLVPVSLPDLGDNPDDVTKTKRIRTAIAKAIVLAHVVRPRKPRSSP